MLSYLAAENSYFEQQMAPLAELTSTIFAELKGRQPKDDASVPYLRNGWMYQWRFVDGAQYRTWWRWPADHPQGEVTAKIFLDEPALAGSGDYFRLGGMAISQDGRYLAYAIDTKGSERFQLRIRDLGTGDELDDAIDNVDGSLVWAADNKTLFYSLLSDQWRPYLVRRHELGTPTKTDVDVYKEHDDSFFVGVSSTQSDAYIVVSSGDHVTSELRVLNATTPTAELTLIAQRNPGHQYDIDHQGDNFYLLTNDTHKNFRLAVTPTTAPAQINWQSVIEGSDEHYLTDFVCFKDFIALEERKLGLDQIRLLHNNGREEYIEFPEPTYSAGLGSNAEFDTQRLRIGYDSMVTPRTAYDYDLASAQLISRKVQQIPSGYDAANYVSERRLIRARTSTIPNSLDGPEVDIPVSLVWNSRTRIGPDTPLYLYGYGAYGNAIAPSFSTARLSLLDRGFVYAIAHIRGGDDLGYHWYEDGKLDKRTNTFNDFVDVASGLIEAGISSAGKIVIAGGSAGGELMGAVVNQAPELWGAVVSHVPFVDVLNTMLDGSLPLTPMEWPEWGNPITDAAAFEYIRSYSPYDQLQARDYPPMLVTAGLNDPRVTYWEPAKYVAKLRHLKTDTNRLLLKTNMSAGHSGKSGRFESLSEVAEEYAFVLGELGLNQ